MCHSCLDTGSVVYGSDTESGRVEEPCRECGVPYRGRSKGGGEMVFHVLSDEYRRMNEMLISCFKAPACGGASIRMRDSASAPVQPVRLRLDSKNKEE
jgi:hypothetical protein